MRISLILVATVARYSSDVCAVARRTDAWGYAGAEPGTRPTTVRGPRVGRVRPSIVPDARGSPAGSGNNALGGPGDRDLLAGTAGPVAQLDRPLRQPAADGHDRGHAQQLGVLELHPGRHLRAVVVEHREAGGHQLLGQ